MRARASEEQARVDAESLGRGMRGAAREAAAAAMRAEQGGEARCMDCS